MSNESLFEVSAKLQEAAIALERVGRGQPLADADPAHLRWVGAFLARVQLDDHLDTATDNHLATQATEARPTFYNALIRTRSVFFEAGLRTDSDLQSFFKALYELLASGKSDNSGTTLNVGVAVEFLETLSNGLLLQLKKNNAPPLPNF